MTYLCLERSERNGEKHDKKKPLIPLMNEGLGELKGRRHFVLYMEAQEDTIRETCGLLKEERRAVTNLAASSGKAKQKKEIL